MTTDKLYIKSVCMTCRGKRGLSCPYCDLDGKNYIEASDKSVIQYLKGIEKDRLESILEVMDAEREKK